MRLERYISKASESRVVRPAWCEMYCRSRTHLYGRDDADHDSCLVGFTKKCQQKGIKLNLAKLEYKCKKVPFHGHVLISEGLKPDPQKVEAITKMSRPEKPEDVLSLNGMVKYLSRFLPNLSDVMKLRRDLTHKDVEWCWSNAQESAWDEVKSLIASAPVLLQA